MKKVYALPNLKKIKVLIIDDSQLVAIRLKEMVKEIVYVSDIFIAENYADSIALLEKVEPDMVLLDIHLQNENGIDLLKFIRNNYPSIKVIMVTNQATAYYRTLCEDLGSHGFIDKTEEFENIPAIIDAVY